MAQQAEVIEEGLEKLQSMFRSVESEFEKIQGQVSKRRAEFEKEAQRRVKKMSKEVRNSPLYKRADSFLKEANRQIEKNVDYVLGSLNIATRSDIRKLDKRLSQINKKLKELNELQGGQ